MSGVFRMFEKHRASLLRVIRNHLGSHGDAEDVLQEAFVRAYAAERKRGVDHPKAFLFQVARNTAIGELRRVRSSPIDGTVDLDADSLSSDTVTTDVSEVLEGRRKLHAFTMAVVRLPPRRRQAFLLRRIEGLSYRQIANRMGISVSAVEKHVAIGLLSCHSYMTEQGYDLADMGRSGAADAKRQENENRSVDGT